MYYCLSITSPRWSLRPPHSHIKYPYNYHFSPETHSTYQSPKYTFSGYREAGGHIILKELSEVLCQVQEGKSAAIFFSNLNISFGFSTTFSESSENSSEDQRLTIIHISSKTSSGLKNIFITHTMSLHEVEVLISAIYPTSSLCFTYSTMVTIGPNVGGLHNQVVSEKLFGKLTYKMENVLWGCLFVDTLHTSVYKPLSSSAFPEFHQCCFQGCPPPPHWESSVCSKRTSVKYSP